MFEKSQQGAVTIIGSDEPLTCDNVEQALVLFDECGGDGQPMAVIDLGHVQLLDSAGLELLVDKHEEFERCGGALKIASPNALCQDALQVTGVADRMEIYAEVSEAVRSFLQ